MPDNFFKLNKPFEAVDNATFVSRVDGNSQVCDLLYKPDELKKLTVNNVAFQNVSFSKTNIEAVTFNECNFSDCLFIGTRFQSVEFHDCCFERCNFYKSSFNDVYAKPQQFRKAICASRYANIAVHLYHQLRENYYRDSQREYKNEAEYYFGHWNRKNEYLQAKRRKKAWYKYRLQHLASFLYGYLLGYGYRVRNLAATTLISILGAILVNYWCTQFLFATPVKPSLFKTTYFTLTTMATLGASGYTPDTEIGYAFVIINVIFGISVFSATISAILKKVIR